MPETLAPEHFSDWNEEMVQRYGQEAFERHPSAVVRWVENKRVNAVLRKLIPYAGLTVLDAGCGNGNILSQIRDCELHGVDLSQTMVAKAQLRLGDKAKIIQADAEKLPFPDATFDRVVASSLFSHVLHPEAVVSELKRVCKPGGVIVVSVCDDDQIERGIRWTQSLGLQKRFFSAPDQNGKASVYSIEYHLHRFSLKRLREVVGQTLTEVSLTKAPTFVFPVHWIAVYKK